MYSTQPARDEIVGAYSSTCPQQCPHWSTASLRYCTSVTVVDWICSIPLPFFVNNKLAAGAILEEDCEGLHNKNVLLWNTFWSLDQNHKVLCCHAISIPSMLPSALVMNADTVSQPGKVRKTVMILDLSEPSGNLIERYVSEVLASPKCHPVFLAVSAPWSIILATTSSYMQGTLLFLSCE